MEQEVKEILAKIIYAVHMGQRQNLDGLVRRLVELKGAGNFEVELDGKRYVVNIEEVKSGLEAAFAALLARQYGVASDGEAGVNCGVAVAPTRDGMYVHIWYSRELLEGK